MPLSARQQVNNILALWRVSGPTYDSLRQEAESDAALFIAQEQGLELSVLNCTPAKLSSTQVEQWKGWAVITWGFVEPQLLLHTITAQEDLALRLVSLRSQP